MDDPTGLAREGSSVHQHVNDLTQPVWTKGQKWLGRIAVKTARRWYKEAGRLKIHIAIKTIIMPRYEAADEVQAHLKLLGLDVKVGDHGVDVGVDCTAGKTRNSKQP